MRSKNRPVSSMMRNTTASVSGTAAATTMPTRQPRLSRLTSSTTPSAIANFIMNSSTAEVMLTAWSVTLSSVIPSGSVCAMAAVLSSSALPSARPSQLLHNGREHDGGLTLTSDEVCGRIFIAAADLGDVGELQRPPRSDDRRVGDRLNAVISAVDPDEDRGPRCRSSLPA